MGRHTRKTLKVMLPLGIVDKIDQLVEDGFFLDREDFIKYAVYYKLDTDVEDSEI